MQHIESTITINAPLEIVWKLAQDVEKLPDIMPDLDKILILEREQRSVDTLRVVTEWHGRITKFNRKVNWVEEDIWNNETHSCHFWQLRGDFAEYSGSWIFVDTGVGTRVDLVIDYTFEVPLIGKIIQKVVLNLMQDNSDGMLKSLKDEAERLAR